jgi:phosphate starvation-inducible membrane PsiE
MILQHPTTKLDLLLISIAILVMALSLKFISKL